MTHIAARSPGTELASLTATVPRGENHHRQIEAASADLEGDLCVTCRNAEVCVYCTPDRDPVRSCTGYVALGVGAAAITTRSATGRPPGRGHVAGLCVNCALRDECTLDRPASGVWHCADYC